MEGSIHVFCKRTEVSIHFSVIYRRVIQEIDGHESTDDDPSIISELFFEISPDVQHDQFYRTYTVQKMIKEYLDSVSPP